MLHRVKLPVQGGQGTGTALLAMLCDTVSLASCKAKPTCKAAHLMAVQCDHARQSVVVQQSQQPAAVLVVQHCREETQPWQAGKFLHTSRYRMERPHFASPALRTALAAAAAEFSLSATSSTPAACTVHQAQRGVQQAAWQTSPACRALMRQSRVTLYNCSVNAANNAV